MASIIATAPGRCGIIGNPTDMYGGSVVSCTTLERAECRIDLHSDVMRIINMQEAASLYTKADLQLRGDTLDIARAALTFYDVDPATTPISLHLTTNIPMRAGLAGSTAMLTTLVGALDMYLGFQRSPYHLAETTRRIEARILNIMCGMQDAHMTVFGGLNFMDFAGKEDLEQRDEEPLGTIEPLASLLPEPPLLLAHTGVEHHSGTVHMTPRQRWVAGEPLVRDSYTQIAKLARRGKRALVEYDWSTLGELMNENHRLVADLGGSGPANERLIEAARRAGAWGAKLAGAGGGGTIIALTNDPVRVGAALQAAGVHCLLTPRPQPGLTVMRDE